MKATTELMGLGEKLLFSSEITNLHVSLGEIGLELNGSRHDSAEC